MLSGPVLHPTQNSACVIGSFQPTQLSFSRPVPTSPTRGHAAALLLLTGWDTGLRDGRSKRSTGQGPHTCPSTKTGVTVNFIYATRLSQTSVISWQMILETNASCPFAFPIAVKVTYYAEFLCTWAGPFPLQKTIHFAQLIESAISKAMLQMQTHLTFKGNGGWHSEPQTHLWLIKTLKTSLRLAPRLCYV